MFLNKKEIKWEDYLVSKLFTFEEFLEKVLNEQLDYPQYLEAKNVLVDGKDVWSWKRDKNLFVWLWGKNSGKGTVAVVLELYAFYSLVNMFSPQKFFGILPNDELAFVNVALSGDQSRVNIFDRIKNRLLRSEYFKQNYTILEAGKKVSSGSKGTIEISQKTITFKEKNIRIYSEHSEYEHWEGKNVVFFVLDEYSGAKSQVELEWAKNVLNSLVTSNRDLPYIGIVMSYMRLDKEFDATAQLVSRIERGEIEKAYASRRFTWEMRPSKYQGEFFVYTDKESGQSYFVPVILKQQFQIDEDSARRKYLCISGKKAEMEIFFNYPERVLDCIDVNRKGAIDYQEEFIKVQDRTLFRLKVNSVKLTPDRFYVIAIDKGEKNSDTALAIGCKERVNINGNFLEKVVILDTLVWRPLKELNVVVDTDNVNEVLFEILKHLPKSQVLIRIDHWQSSDLVNRCLKQGYRAVQKNASRDGYETLKVLVENMLISFPDTQITRQGYVQIKYLKEKASSKPRVSVGKQDIVDVWAEVCEELVNLNTIKMSLGKVVQRPSPFTNPISQKMRLEVENFFIKQFSKVNPFPIGRVIPGSLWIERIKRRVGE
jgi:hypothetical protein